MKNDWLDGIEHADAEVQHRLSNPAKKTATPLDTGLKWAPLAILLTAKAVGSKTKSSFKQQAVRVVIAEAILNITMLPIKKVVNRERPNGQSKSFPSGHAATGFLSSQILYEELRETNPALSYTGYALSVVTCVLRLYHNKHWLSDVAAGAVLGFLSAKLSRRLIAEKHGQRNKYLKPGNLLM